MRNHSLALLKFKHGKKTKNVSEVISVKPIILNAIIEEDDSTINYVKRIGGQVFQFYSIHTKNISLSDDSVFYYLTSSIYPIRLKTEITSHRLGSILINVSDT